ncbi:hypothetical protein T484DRAFT_1758127 [Baffinella frigidus]|nr:hypothetical protein T484DRAFT_1758127 [Cryptophyta sp. CCMP2293]
MLHTSTTRQKVFAEKVDLFGASYTERVHTPVELDNLLEKGEVSDEVSSHSDGDDLCEVEEDSAEGLDTNHLPWSVFKGVVARMLPLAPFDEGVVAFACRRLVAGGAIIATPDDHSFFDRVTHIVVVGNSVSPECNLLDTVRSALSSPIPEKTTPLARSANGNVRPRKRRHGQQEPAAKWVVVSEAWVKARSDAMPLPEPLLVQPIGD